MEMKRMNKEEKFERSLIVSEEGRAIRLYLTLHPFAFEGVWNRGITEGEIGAVLDIFGAELDEDEIMDKIFHGRLERLFMHMETMGLVRIVEKKNGLTEYLMDDITHKNIRKILGV
jgi:hypothetical protein